MVKNNKIVIGVILLVILLPVAGLLGLVVFRQSSSSVSLGSAQMRSPILMKNDMAEVSRNIAQDSAAPDMASNPTLPTASDERKIIKNGSMNIMVEDVVDSANKISEYARQQGGFLVSSYLTDREFGGSAPHGTVVIRVPSKQFESALAHVRTMGEVKSEHVDGQDITEQYTDLESQLRNLKATEDQFLAILEDATRVEDVLAVQRELTNIRTQIDWIEGRITYLDESVALSLITVNLTTDPRAVPIIDDRDTWKPGAVFKEAVRGLIDAGKMLVNVLIWIAVFAPVWLILAIGVWWFTKKRKQ